MSATSPYVLTPAEVDFDGGRPVSRAFDDIYFDADGPAEVARVFLGPADFEARTADPATTFTVGELGFGTGLSFVVAAHAARCRLHFISVERHPLSVDDMVRSLASRATAFPLARRLIEHYPPLVAGWHRRLFEGGRIQLSVFFGDVKDALADLERQQQRGVDAWFLDGFAPPRNPEMWDCGLFETMARLSAHRATVTTFTAAGHVRRDLAAAGFEVRRVDQHPHKRHSTAGVYAGSGRTFLAPREAAVLGAGLAGTATARALAEKGIAVRLMDTSGGISQGASRIPAAVLHTRLSPATSVLAAFRLHAFAYAAHRCRGRPGTTASGVLQLPGPTMDAERLARTAQVTSPEIAQLLDPDDASSCAGMLLDDSALFFPQALTIDGHRLSKALSGHTHIDIAATPSTDTMPTVRATGANITGFDWLEVGVLAGQMDRFGCGRSPKLPIVGNGTVVPAEDSVWTGATYEYRPWTPSDATSANAGRFRRLLGTTPGRSLERFRGIRAVTSDRVPVIGCNEGVWFNLGHGSHGTVSAILGAEIVASAIAGEVAPVTSDILGLVRPDRFLERQQRRPNPFATSGRLGRAAEDR